MKEFTARHAAVLALLTLVWGLNWPVMKTGATEYAPLSFRTLSMWFGLPVLVAVLAWTRMPWRIPRRHWPELLLLTLTNMLVWHVVAILAVRVLSSGRAAILGYTIVDDFGETINPALLAGQVHGGVVQGFGQAMQEHTVYEDGSGQLVTGSFMDYTLPRATDVPMFDFNVHNVRCTTNPLGIKGSGEAGAIGAPPAVISAVVDALRETTGQTHIDMPATPLAIWKAIQGAKSVRAA